MKHRSLLAAVSGLAVVAASTLPAASAPSDPAGPSGPTLTTQSASTLTPNESEAGKVAPSLAESSGTVTAFVQLDTPSGVELAEQGASPAQVEDNQAVVERIADSVVPAQTNARSARAAGAPEQVSVTSRLVPGVVVTGDAEQIRALAADAQVVTVYRIVPKTPSNKGSDAFTRALEAWQSTGYTGQGVRIGIIDTGIDYTHAGFGGPGTQAAYDQAYGVKGRGPVPAGTFDDAKYLGGHDFAGYDYDASGTVPGTSLIPTPDENPIDSLDSIGSGHGSHVAGTTGGYGVLADGTTFDGDYSTLTDISDWTVGPGSAPESGLYALKVFGDLGGSTSVVVDALEFAADPDGDGDLSDRLDIVNLSLGSDNSPADDPENLFIDQLSRLGTLAVVASGNAGDVTDVGGSPGNSRTALTVANSVGNTQTFDGVEVTAPAGVAGSYPAQNSQSYTGAVDVTAEVAFLGATVSGCTPLTAAQRAATAGKIAFLYWDDNDASRACGSATRFNNAQAAGAVGVLLSSELEVFAAGIAGNAGIPGAQLTGPSHDALRPAIEAGGVVMTLGPSFANSSFVEVPAIGDTLNGGSSRGVHGSLGIVKPDVAAPGTGISSVASGRLTQPGIKSGTSMSTPHVAGIAALVKEAHPGWSAQQVKTAVMNTASHDVWTGQGGTGTAYGPERVGSGRVDALDAVNNATLAFSAQDRDLVSVSYGLVPVADKTVKERRTVDVQNTGSGAVKYAASFRTSSSAGGATVTVSPANLTIPAGQTRTVTLTLTADPATLAKQLDPTSATTTSGVPRDFVGMLTGRLVLTPESGSELRVPVQAAPRLVSDLEGEDVTFLNQDTSAELVLDGRGVGSGGWTSLVAPFELKATSPRLEANAAEGSSASAVASGDIRAVGFSSTAPQYAAGGADPGDGRIGIGVAMDGDWASLGAVMFPSVETDVDGDGSPEFETVVRKYNESDLTLATTYTLKDWTGPDGEEYGAGEGVLLEPVNSVWADVDTSVFDSNVLVVPVAIGELGIAPGTVPSFTVTTYSYYGTQPDQSIDRVGPFTGDPYDPAYWFSGGGQLLYVGAADRPLTVNRSAAATEAGTGELLLLHLHNAKAAERWETVDVSTLDASVALTVTAQSRCVAGKAQVAVRAVNDSGAKADVVVSTPFGDKTFKGVAPGKSASQSFSTRATSIEAGAASVTGTAVVEGITVTTPYEAGYEAISCS